MEYFTLALKKYADFSGRARRKEYWMFTLICTLFSVSLMVIEAALGIFGISILFSLAMFIPSLSILVRRLHDTNHSAWWLLIGLIPVIGAIAILIFCLLDSDDANPYGFNPKANTVF
ncbi:hypothetical protein MED121_03893 [Marinomonas sp. MED121]|uniref:DUF805 domain-containing protein n=1 Tax=Marinomonas sp. MED121 TaxID=314277 RepID=UPI000068FAA2|nr:DUF805 domain-containing protein [Marinomonas sp. MED121]EAQ63882.1 hypothetical protein MED121_03893 [Marinomonas sp. MED121]